jgi:hypothetical protein
MWVVYDESRGTRSGYDKAYVDENMNNDLSDDVPKKVGKALASAKRPQYIRFGTKLGKYGNAVCSIGIFSLSRPQFDKSTYQSKHKLHYSVNIAEWPDGNTSCFFTNGEATLYPSARAAAAGSPVTIGDYDFSIHCKSTKKGVFVRGEFKDKNGASLRHVFCSSKLQQPPYTFRDENGYFVTKKCAFG